MSPFQRSSRITRELDVHTRKYERNYEGFIAQLDDEDPLVRRHGARDLSEHPRAVSRLLEALSSEGDQTVRDAIASSLIAIGNDEVVRGLFYFLRSEDAALRNAAVEALQTRPKELRPYLKGLLRDEDPDVRILTIGIVGAMSLPEGPSLLEELLKNEEQVNVVGAAVDALVELGSPETLTTLALVKDRFADEPYLRFAVEAAIRRIKG